MNDSTDKLLNLVSFQIITLYLIYIRNYFVLAVIENPCDEPVGCRRTFLEKRNVPSNEPIISIVKIPVVPDSLPQRGLYLSSSFALIAGGLG